MNLIGSMLQELWNYKYVSQQTFRDSLLHEYSLSMQNLYFKKLVQDKLVIQSSLGSKKLKNYQVIYLLSQKGFYEYVQNDSWKRFKPYQLGSDAGHQLVLADCLLQIKYKRGIEAFSERETLHYMFLDKEHQKKKYLRPDGSFKAPKGDQYFFLEYQNHSKGYANIQKLIDYQNYMNQAMILKHPNIPLTENRFEVIFLFNDETIAQQQKQYIQKSLEVHQLTHQIKLRFFCLSLETFKNEMQLQ